MAKYVNTFYRLANRAYMRDRFDNEYTGDQLMLALLLSCKGVRNEDNEKYIAELMDDPNIEKGSRGII